MSKVEEILHWMVADPSIPATAKHRLLLTNSAASNLNHSVHDTVEKSVNARLLVRKEAVSHLAPDLKHDILLSDPFHPDSFHLMQ